MATGGNNRYGCEFVDPPPEILPTECSICLHILRNPHQVSCCGQHFCKSCIKRIQSENKPCPLCNQRDYTTMLDKSVQRNLNGLNVHCPNKEQGCEWVGEIRDLDHHINANPKSGEELTGCEYVELSCIHGCGGRFQRCSLTEHHNKCPLRPFRCQYCSYSSTYQDVVNNHWVKCHKYPLKCPNGCEGSPIERKDFDNHKTTCPLRPFRCDYCSYLSTYQDVVTNHMVECPKFPLPCPNSCEDSPIERQHLKDHLKQDCPLEMVDCEFQFVGCTAQVQRKDLEAHMKDNLPQHISQLSSTTKTLVTDVRDEMNQKLDQMEQRQLQTGGVKQEQAEVKARQDNLERQLKQHKQTVNNASDNTKCYGMTVVTIIVAVAAVLAAAVIMHHQQIQLLRQEVTIQVQQLQQDHVEATEQIQHLRQDRIKATEQIQQLRQDHVEATDQIQQLQQDHVEATDQIQQLQQDHVEATELIQKTQQHHVEATQQLKQDNEGATGQTLSGDLRNHVSVLVSPPICTAEGPGLHSPTVNKKTEITVSVVNYIGSEYTGTGVSVTAELESEEDGSITQANISRVEASKYRVTYTPRVRGWSKLHVKINNSDIKGSPFSLFVSPKNPLELKGLDHPWGIAINSRGEIYVTEWFGDRVSVFDTNRQKLRTFGCEEWNVGGNFRYPTDIDIDMDDYVYVASQRKLTKFNRNGGHIKSVSSSKEIRGVGVHNDKVYVSDNHRILVYDQELVFIRQFGTHGTGKGEFDRPHDIAFDAYGNAYVVDSGNNRVQVLKGDGKFLRQFGREELNYPCGIHVNGDYVYVSDRNSVVVFRTSGEFVTTIGENLSEAHGITTDSNGRLYVCEKTRHRCIIF